MAIFEQVYKNDEVIYIISKKAHYIQNIKSFKTIRSMKKVYVGGKFWVPGFRLPSLINVERSQLHKKFL